MRPGHPLKYFKGTSKYYVFLSSGSDKHPDYVEDYDVEYDDNCSFIELIGNIVRSETKDDKYALKIMEILARELKVKQHMRKKPLTFNEWWKLTQKEMKKFKKTRFYKQWLQKGSQN